MSANPARKRPPRANNAEDSARFYLPLYVGLGATRSVSRVYEIANAMGVRVSKSTIARYSQIGGWVEAARKFDAERAQSVQHFAIDQIMSNEARQVQIGRLYQEASIAELAKRNRLGDEIAPDSLASIARIGDVGVKIERLASGEATSIHKVVTDVYQVFIIGVIQLFNQSQEAQRAVLVAAGVADESLLARVHNAAAGVIGPGVDQLVGQHLQSLGIRDVVIGEAAPTDDSEDDE